MSPFSHKYKNGQDWINVLHSYTLRQKSVTDGYGKYTDEELYDKISLIICGQSDGASDKRIS